MGRPKGSKNQKAKESEVLKTGVVEEVPTPPELVQAKAYTLVRRGKYAAVATYEIEDSKVVKLTIGAENFKDIVMGQLEDAIEKGLER